MLGPSPDLLYANQLAGNVLDLLGLVATVGLSVIPLMAVIVWWMRNREG